MRALIEHDLSGGMIVQASIEVYCLLVPFGDIQRNRGIVVLTRLPFHGRHKGRADGTLRKPVTIWVARLGDDLYVRAVGGRTSPWFRGTQDQHEGHIESDGVEKDVTFANADDDVHDQIDAAYRAKYHRYPKSYVDSVVSPQAKAATLTLVQRITKS